MEHNRKQKLLMIIALVASIMSLSVGFAAFSVSLNISSSVSVAPNSDTFSVKFSTSNESLVVDEVVPSDNPYNLYVTNGIINNGASPTVGGLSAIFTSPGQYVEYTFFVRNEGEYIANLNGLNLSGEKVCIAESGTTESLVQDACEHINAIVMVDGLSYNHRSIPLAQGEWDEVIVRLEYLETGPSVDGAFSISFPNVVLTYSTAKRAPARPHKPWPSKFIKLESGDLNTPGSIASIGDEKFYVIGQEDGNVKLLSMYNLYVGNSVDDNGVIALSNPTGTQNSKAIGFFDGYSSENPIIGTTAFSHTGASYAGSIVEGYVNDYVSFLENLGANIEEARLITIEELETLGCSCEDYTCSGAPEFVYKTSYWSEPANDANDVWNVDSSAGFDFNDCNDDYGHGVRPVIEISVSEF